MLCLNTEADPDQWRRKMEEFLPLVDNWMVADSVKPACMGAHPGAVAAAARQWTGSEHAYTVRVGVCVLMGALRTSAYAADHLDWVAGIDWDDYYVQMVCAWYFATAFDAHREDAVPYVAEPGPLPDPVRRRALRKILESRRTTPEERAWVRALP